MKLIRYDAACRAIAACVRVDEAKKIRDEFISLQAYAKQSKNKQMEADCLEIRMRATRRLGEMMAAQERAGVGDNKRFSKNPLPTLGDAGIDKNLAHQARTLGRMTARQFDSAVNEARDAVTSVVQRAVRVSNIEEARRGYDRRKEDGGSYRDLKQMIREGRKFSVIYADPPWNYETYSGKGKERSADRHYDTMELDEIKALPIYKLAAENCALFLWATWPHMQNALDVIKMWGFEYKTGAFDWIKTNKGSKTIYMGMGHWTRANSEPCLLATIGSPMRIHNDVRQVVMSPILRHSEKPEEVRKRIERLLRGPYLELFGRKLIDGWTVWGNEVPFVYQQAAE